jgi:enoyl-CoA hydratase/carnithine racemase
MPDPHLSLCKNDGLAYLVIDRPEARNAMSLSMWRTVPELIADVTADRSIKVLIVQGREESVFASGADIGELGELVGSADAAAVYMDAVHGAEQAIAHCPKPVIAMIRGHCVGGGIELALGCDLRFASEQSTFTVPPARLGVIYSLSSTKRLVDLVGPGRARDLLFSGRVIEAGEALSMGLIEQCWPAERTQAETQAYAEMLCRRSQYAIRGGKQIVAAVLDGATQEDAILRQLRIDAFLCDDLAEGARAFFEKRKPSFRWT